MNSSSHNEQSSCDSSCLPIAESSSQSSHSHHASSVPLTSNAASQAARNREGLGGEDKGAEESLSGGSKQDCSSENNELAEARRGGAMATKQ